MTAALVKPVPARVLGSVSLAPFPAEELPRLWAWLNEYPKANFDDTGPKTLEEFLGYQLIAAKSCQKLIGVKCGGEWVGAIAFQPMTDGVGVFRGICFSKTVHGQGVARQAVGAVLSALWAEGFRKVRAEYMADNRRVRHFLAKLGAIDEGYFKADTLRGGKPIDVRRVAFIAPREAA